MAGAHPAGTKYTGKYGYPVKSDLCVDDVALYFTSIDASPRLPPMQRPEWYHALLIPGGFAPDYMRRNKRMLDITVAMADAGKPVASSAAAALSS